MKAVLFDVYETLLTGTRHADREARLRRVIRQFGLEFPDDQALAERLDLEIRLEHQQSSEEHPEVDIREIWRRIFPRLDDPEPFALAAENAVHPVAAIPGAEETLLKLDRRGLKLGIISNAQAYTRKLLKRHLPEAWNCFDSGLLFFSYEHRISKPDSHLFRLAIDRLARDGIHPGEVLMVGDSETNDIGPARSLGLTTHLVRGVLPDLSRIPAGPEDQRHQGGL